MTYKKKLIEVALPLEAINNASAREKSIRHGHPSTLHQWWSRKPTAAARAVIWSSLIDDPSTHPDQFPTEEAQAEERQRLFKILEDLVIWENINNEKVLNDAKAEILKSTDGNPPPLLDPFAGGGAIPLEAQRLGLKAYASDLNPVAVMINKAMIEIPPKFANQPPVNPEARGQIGAQSGWKGVQGMAEDIRYYSEWMRKKAYERIGHLYPTVKDKQGIERTVIAWLWARTVQCPNPACKCELPLINSHRLSNKKGRKVYLNPIITPPTINFEIKKGDNAVEPSRVGRGIFRCYNCGQSIDVEFVKQEGVNGRIKYKLLAIATEGKGRRYYVSPKDIDKQDIDKNAVERAMLLNLPLGNLPDYALGFNVQFYGPKKYVDLFTNRQIICLMTFSELVARAHEKVIEDGGSKTYANSIAVYLAFLVDKLADLGNAYTGWEPNAECPRHLFGRQTISFIPDFAEGNPFSNSSGSWKVLQANLANSLASGAFDFTRDQNGKAKQIDAQVDSGLRGVMISTDPPYYDNIGYGDLSDFFYIWLRESLKEFYPEIFSTILVPKNEELIANPHRFERGSAQAKLFFEDGMLKTFKNIFLELCDEIPLTVYYAYKQVDYKSEGTSSTGWETFLSAIITSGFIVTGTWPIRTETASRLRGQDSNALASSIVLVCRKRKEETSITTRGEFLRQLKRELKPALSKLQQSNIAPVDMAQAAIGPGMSVFSRYAQVLEADGTAMSVRTALQLINQELDVFFTEQDSDLDRDSRFCVDLFTQFAFNEMNYGEAEVLALAKNISIDRLAQAKVLMAEKGRVRLLTREELPDWKPNESAPIWLITQQLTKAMESGGNRTTAAIIESLRSGEVERAKSLAYRLFSIADRKGWGKEAFAYNTLVNSWKDVQASVAELSAQARDPHQGSLF